MNRNSFGHAMRRHWQLEEGMHFLNHGSFGATPSAVLEDQANWRSRMEAQPVRFFTSELPEALRHAAHLLGGFIGTRGEQLVFVDNATTAVNTVLASFPWQSGEEVLMLAHAYPAVANAARSTAERHGLTLRSVPVALPVDPDQLVEAFDAAINPRIRLAIIDHVSSPLAVVYPVERLVRLCRERGVAVLVDGAHAPGMLPLDVERINPDWYTGNCHKWLYAPKGSAFLWASSDAPMTVRPLAISLKSGEGFPMEFDWTGTRDPTAWLSVPAGIEFMEMLGPEVVRAYMHNLVVEGAEALADAWGTQLLASPESFAAMATISLPESCGSAQADAKRLHDWLWQAHRIEVPVLCLDERLHVRISAQVYNEIGDYLALGRSVAQAFKLG